MVAISPGKPHRIMEKVHAAPRAKIQVRRGGGTASRSIAS